MRRERKKERTRAAIHTAALDLFEKRGFDETTIADIAEAADVSRATFFSYYPSKDGVVFGDVAPAVDALRALLDDLPEGLSTLGAVREWLRTDAGWLGGERLQLQLRLAGEHPSVGAHRRHLHGRFEDVVAGAVARELEADDPVLVARLVAAALAGAMNVAESTEADAREVERILETTMAFIDGGLHRVGADMKN